MRKSKKKYIAVMLAAVMLCGLSANASAASIPGGRITGKLDEDKYIPANNTTIAKNYKDTVVEETTEASSTNLTKNMKKLFNMDDVRTGGSDAYVSQGKAYYDTGNGRGVSYTPLTGNNSIFGNISSPFGADERFNSGASIYTSARSANNVAALYRALREEAEDGTPIVKSISNAADYFNKLAAYYHALQKISGDSKTYSTALDPNGKIMMLGDTESLGNQAYNGYGPEFESDDVRGTGIIENGILNSDGLDMVNGAKTFVGSIDNPYGDLFEAKDNIEEDCYILIRRLLGVNDNGTSDNKNPWNELNSTPREEIKAINEDNGNISAAMDAFLNKLIDEAKKYERDRQRQVNQEVRTAQSIIRSALSDEPIASRTGKIHYCSTPPDSSPYGSWWRTGHETHGRSHCTYQLFDPAGFAAARRNWWSQNIERLPNWQNSELPTDYSAGYSVNTTPYTSSGNRAQLTALLADINNKYGKFQASSREAYDLANEEAHKRYQAICDILGNGDYDYEFESQRDHLPDGFDIDESSDYSTDESEGLFWINSVLTGTLDIPSVDGRMPTFEEYIESQGYDPDEVKAFREWLIDNGLYYNPANTSSPYNGWTISPEEWEDGKLLELWKAVYYVPSVDNVQSCLETGNHAYYGDDERVAELQSIADAIVANTDASEYNKFSDSIYPYLDGYTNASFIPKQTAVSDFSVFDNAMSFYRQLGMDSDKNNIPAEKHMNLGFYKDVEVTGYSNNIIQTSGILGRYEWYVYYSESGSKESAEVVYHDTTTSLECPFTAVQSGTYWIDCYQSGYTTYEERMQYTVTYFLTEEITQTVLMSSLTPDIQIRLDEKTVAEKVKLHTDENGYVVDDAAMQWRAYGDRVVENFTTQRVSDTGDVNLG